MLAEQHVPNPMDRQPTALKSLTQVLPPKPSFNSVFTSESGSQHSALRLASALGSDDGTQSHVKKGAASSVKNFLLGRCGQLVSAKQRWDAVAEFLREQRHDLYLD